MFRGILVSQLLVIVFGCIATNLYASTVVLELQPVVALEDSSLALNDIAKVYASKEHRESIAGSTITLPKRFLAQSLIERKTLEAVIRAQLGTSDKYDLVFSGPKLVRVSKVLAVDRNVLKMAAASFLHDSFIGQYPSIEIDGYTSANRIDSVPGWNSRLVKTDKPYSRHCVWMDEVAGSKSGIPFCFSVSVNMQLPVATKELEVGAFITPDDFEFNEVDLAEERFAPFLGFDEGKQMVVSSRILPGEPLLINKIKEKPAVSINSWVTLVSNVGSVSIMTKALALKDAKVGEPVAVKVINTDNIVVGQVHKEDMVLVAQGENG